jgi:hypothetical protein
MIRSHPIRFKDARFAAARLLGRVRARRALVGVAVVALAAVASLALPSAAGASYIGVKGVPWYWLSPSPQGDSLSSVCFADAQHGWAVGAGGTILTTGDRGATWTAQSANISQLVDVAFADPLH